MSSENISFIMKNVDMYFKKRLMVVIPSNALICDLCKSE